MAKLLIRDLAEVVSPAGTHAPLRGAADMSTLDAYKDAYVLCEDGRVSAVGRMSDLLHLAVERSEVAHASDGAHAPVLAEDVRVLERVERTHVRPASERRVSARRRHDLREITDEDLRHRGGP